MQLTTRKAFFVVISALLVVGLLEITLGLAAFFSPKVERLLASPWLPDSVAPIVPDAGLGHRPNPLYPGHDSKGFRNPAVPAKAHIVALGDSQTYGTGVKPEEAWPRQLETMTGTTVYSMAYGGYGPTHCLVLWEEAVALSPKIVITAFYAGNDLFDSFDHVYNQGQLPELKSPDAQLQASVREAEQSEPLSKRVSRMVRSGTKPVAVEKEATIATRDGVSPWRLLAGHSKIYGLLRRARYEGTRLINKSNNMSQEEWGKAQAFAEAHPEYCQVFADGQFKTIFTSQYRLSALDLGDPRTAEGLQISLRALQRMHELAAARNILFLVALLPTKEAVFCPLWKNPPKSYRSLTENEERVWRTTKSFLEQTGIAYLDFLPVLRKQLATGLQPYQVSQDGHPNEQGHAAIAKRVAAYLAATKILQAQAEQDAAPAADKPRR